MSILIGRIVYEHFKTRQQKLKEKCKNDELFKDICDYSKIALITAFLKLIRVNKENAELINEIFDIWNNDRNEFAEY